MQITIVALSQNQIGFDKITSLSYNPSISQNSIFAILQDRRGSMWFGTQVGLDRFDGHNFYQYYHDPDNNKSITRGQITDLYEYKDLIWVGTEKGLSTIRYNKDAFDFEISQILDTVPVKSIVTVIDNNLIFNSSSTVYSYNIDSNELSIIYPLNEHGDKGAAIIAITYSKSLNNIYIGTDKGLFSIGASSNELNSQLRNNFKNVKVDALYISDKNPEILYIGSNSSLFIYNTNLPFEASKKHSLPFATLDLVITSFLMDSSSDLWVGTENSGLYQFSNGNFILHQRDSNTQNSISSNLILSIEESNDSVLWIGTNGGGINKRSKYKQLFNHDFKSFEKDESKGILRFNNDVWSIYQKNELTYLGTDGDGVAVFLSKDLITTGKDKIIKWLQPEKPYSVKSKIITCITEFNGKLIIGSREGLYSAHYTSDTYTRINENKIDVLTIDTFLNYLIIGTRNDGFKIYDKSFNEKSIEGSSWLNQINSIQKVDKDSNILWVGGSEGLIELDFHKSKAKLLKLKNSIQKLDIRCIYYHPTLNEKWISVFGEGVYVLDSLNNQIAHYHRNNLLPDNVVYGILSDQFGDVWLSTNNGLSRIDSHLKTARNYTIRDGLQHGEFNTGAYFKGQFNNNEVLFFGGVRGLNWFEPIEKSYINTPFNISYSYINNGTKTHFVDLANNKIVAPIPKEYDDREILLDFSISDYHDPHNNKIRYKFGTNKWEVAKNGKIFLNIDHLDEGDNNLTLQFRKSYSDWFIQEQILNVQVEPSKISVFKFWSTIASIVIFLIFFLILSILFRIKYKNKKLKGTQSKLEKEINALEEKQFKLERKNQEILTSNNNLLNNQADLKKSNKDLEFQNKELKTAQSILNEANHKLEKNQVGLKQKNKNLEELQTLINKITEQSSPEKIFNVAVNHLTIPKFEIFSFDYAIIYIIDKHKKAIEDSYPSKKRFEFTPPHTKWRDPLIYNDKANHLIQDDILEVVFNKHKEYYVEGDKINLLDKNYSTQDEVKLDSFFFEKNNHHLLKRVFLPIIKRSEPIEGIKEATFCFGVVEAGFSINSNNEITEEKINHVKLYIDNCAQVYHKAYSKEILRNNIDVIKEHYVIEDHTLYLQAVLNDIVKKYNCDVGGDIAFISYEDDEHNWVPKMEDSLGSTGDYFINLKFIERIRKINYELPENKRKKGIYRITFENKNYYFSGDVKNDPYYINGLNEVNSQLSIPLQTQGKFIGTLNLYSTEYSYFDEFKAINLKFLCDTFTDIYYRKRAASFDKYLISPLNHLNEKEIHNELIDYVQKYFLARNVEIFEIRNLELPNVINQEELIANGTYKKYKGFFQGNNIHLIQDNEISKLEQLGLDKSIGKDIKSILLKQLYSSKEKLVFAKISSKREIAYLFPEDSFFLDQLALKYQSTIQSVDLFYTFWDLAAFFAQDTPKDIYQQITDKANKLFQAELTLLFKIIPGVHANLMNVAQTGELIQPIDLNIGHKEPKNTNAIHIVQEKKEVYINDKISYLELFGPEVRKWKSNIWENDFWTREKIVSFAAINLEFENKSLGVLFLNFRNIKPDFNEKFKKLFKAFSRLASQSIFYASLAEDNKQYTESNIKLTKPVIEGFIISGIAHNTGNLIGSLNRSYNRYLKSLRNEVKDQTLRDTLLQKLDSLKAPIEELKEDFRKLSDFRRTDETSFFVNYSLRSILEETITLIENRARKNSIKIYISPDKKSSNYEDCTIECNINSLKHAILNLLINAIEAYKSNGKISIKHFKGNNNAVLEITDHAGGIKKENKDQIFIPYFTTKRGKGTGMGLPITKYIIEGIHKGSINFRTNQRKKTTTFIITLNIVN